LAPRKCRGTPLKVFSGKEATLNRLVLLILLTKPLLTKYCVFLELKATKGHRHVGSKTVYRRIDVLCQEGWLVQSGKKVSKPGWESELYELTLKGKAALKLDSRSIEEFLKVATDEQLEALINLLDF
jgi:DNA-binding PadR family transcriptional regulator